MVSDTGFHRESFDDGGRAARRPEVVRVQGPSLTYLCLDRMFRRMRTTIGLADDPLRDAKREAASTGTTLTALIEDSLRERLYRRSEAASANEPVRLPTYGSGGVLPGIDLDDTSALLDAMDRST